MLGTLIFFYLSGVIVLTATLVVALRNPIYSAMSLLVMFFHVAGLYVTLHAEFLAAIQIIVYAGAILVLYLFVVMLLNIKGEERYNKQSFVALCLGGVLLVESVVLGISQGITVATPHSPSLGEPGASVGNTESIGEILYSTYLFPFEIASLILLVAMVGAVILTKKDIFESKSS